MQKFSVFKINEQNQTSCYIKLSAVHIDVYLRQPRTSSKDYQLYLYFQLEIVYELGQQ